MKFVLVMIFFYSMNEPKIVEIAMESPHNCVAVERAINSQAKYGASMTVAWCVKRAP